MAHLRELDRAHHLGHTGPMRRALRASRAVALAVAQFIYLAFEEAVKASAKAEASSGFGVIPSIHEHKTLPGTFTAPRVDVVPQSPTPPPTLPTLPTSSPNAEAPVDVDTLLRTLQRDLGCATGADETHRACGAATTLGAFMDRAVVLAALEEAVTLARRPRCVQASAIFTLQHGRTRCTEHALRRMLGVAEGRLAWTGARPDRELVATLVRALDV